MDVATRSMRLSRRLLCSIVPLAALAAVSASPADAQVTEEVSIANTYGFLFDGSAKPTPKVGGSKQTIYRGKSRPTQSELGINYTATADSNGFFFLHDNYCVGNCATFSQTVITFTLHNTGDGVEDLRFDSQITPGHIARILGGGGASGSFDFSVRQVTSGESSMLYNATGGVNSDGIFLSTGDLQFNGLTNTITDQYQVVDWGTTNLSLGLNRIGSGETTQVVYTATYMSSGNGDCADVNACAGAQIVFGDPRNNGGVIAFQDRVLDGPGLTADALDPRPVIGGTYAPSFIRAEFVPFDADFPPDPGAPPVLTYDQLFQPRVVGVPEPASWALMIGGFALAGSAARRQRRRLQLA